MYTLGIDVAKHRHHATLLDESGATVFRNVEVPHTRTGVEHLLAKLAAVAPIETIRVGLEATGHYWIPPRAKAGGAEVGRRRRRRCAAKRKRPRQRARKNVQTRQPLPAHGRHAGR